MKLADRAALQVLFLLQAVETFMGVVWLQVQGGKVVMVVPNRQAGAAVVEAQEAIKVQAEKGGN